MKAVAKRITSWSISSLQVYVLCPFKAYCKQILKLKEPSSPALDNGNEVHILAEAYVGAKVPALGWNENPREPYLVSRLEETAGGLLPSVLYMNFAAQFKILRAKKYKTEQMWCFTKDWKLTHDKDWNNIWLRVKTDAHSVKAQRGVIIDYKTGKRYADKHDESLELYALAMFIVYPQLATVIAELWYLDNGEVITATFLASDIPSMKKVWERKTKKMLSDTQFNPTPSDFGCRYCHFSKEKGGPCQAGKQ